MPQSQPKTTQQHLSDAADGLVKAQLLLDQAKEALNDALHSQAFASKALQDGVRPIIEEEPGAVPE